MIVQTLCNSFIRELAEGVHAFETDLFRVALFKRDSDVVPVFGTDITNYSQMGSYEAVGEGYNIGGEALTGGAVETDSQVAVVDFTDLVFPGVSLVTRGALMYNATKGGAAVAVFDFGVDKFVQGNDLTLRLPQPTALLGLIRLRKQ